MLARRRRFLFCVALLAIIGLLVELISFAGLHLYISISPYTSFVDLAAQQKSLADTARAEGDNTVVVHPFTGWAINPQLSQGETAFGKTIPINRLGFADDQESIQKRAPDRLIVGITGGSVAWQMTVGADEVIRAALRQSPVLKDLDIRILRIGQSGYKQPQQLMTVNWLQTLGGEFDAVVNLDGFNEVALTLSENYLRKIHTAYPRAWNSRMLELIDPRDSADRMRLLTVNAHRQSLARGIQSTTWRWSNTAQLVWTVRDRMAQNEKNRLTKELLDKQATREGVGFATSGPLQEITSEDEALEFGADVWLRSSIQLNRLLTSSGTVYLHVLQPNQHFRGSKPLSDAEARLADLGQAYDRKAVESGYPKLRKRIPSLQTAGVEFLDLSMLYQDEAGTMYSDPCCHLNNEGNRRLALKIAIRLRELLEDQARGE